MEYERGQGLRPSRVPTPRTVIMAPDLLFRAVSGGHSPPPIHHGIRARAGASPLPRAHPTDGHNGAGSSIPRCLRRAQPASDPPWNTWIPEPDISSFAQISVGNT